MEAPHPSRVEYHVVIEFDPETRHYTATVPGIPSIVVDGRTERGALSMARKAILIFNEESGTGKRRRGRGRPPTRLRAKVVTVNV